MTEFDLDKQTIKDLEIFTDNSAAKSISNYYNQTKTFGGRKFLFQLMKIPVTDIEELKERTRLIAFLQETGFELKLNSTQFDFIEHYQRLNIAPLRNNFVDAFLQNLSYRINPNNNYYIIKAGVQQLAYLFIQLKEKSEFIEGKEYPAKFHKLWEIITNLITSTGIQNILQKEAKNWLYKIK